jgi:glycosyltransferase involved in cell wall biosynthesis
MNEEINNISVCIATFNGQSYLLEQLNSILIQLDSNDELIIVDDCSSDCTVKLIIELNDDRIKLHKNNLNRGHVYSFAYAIALAKHKIIFLSDQDDIWIEGRKGKMIRELNKSKKLLVSSNFISINQDGYNERRSNHSLKANDSNYHFNNILGIFIGNRDYYGCTMAFKSEIRSIILPMPAFVKTHDLWIALAANIMKSNLHLESITLKRRLHGNNMSKSGRSLVKKINSRIFFLRSVIILYMRLLFNYRLIKKN